MTKQIRKTSKAIASIKSAPRAHRNTDAKFEREAEKIEEDMLEMEEENVQEVIHAAENFDQEVATLTDIGTNTMRAWNETGSTAMNVFSNLGTEVMENWKRLISSYAEMCEEALDCRTAGDMADFQNKAIQRVINGNFDESARICKALFDGGKKTLNPFDEHAALTTEWVRKALAA